MRLSKFLAQAGVASRREAEAVILAGRVTVNGQRVFSPGLAVDPPRDSVRLDRKRLRPPPPKVWILLNKPRGSVTTRMDPQGRLTVMDLLKGLKAHVNPVGRLDYDVTGVLLLTNDGTLAHRLTHPRYGVTRAYRVKVRGTPSTKVLRRLERGVTLSDGRASAEGVRLERQLQGSAWISLTLREGRNRLLKRMCEAIGHPTVKIQRVRFAGLGRGSLRAGQWRYLTTDEVKALRRRVRLEEGRG